MKGWALVELHPSHERRSPLPQEGKRCLGQQLDNFEKKSTAVRSDMAASVDVVC